MNANNFLKSKGNHDVSLPTIKKSRPVPKSQRQAPKDSFKPKRGRNVSPKPQLKTKYIVDFSNVRKKDTIESGEEKTKRPKTSLSGDKYYDGKETYSPLRFK